MTLMIFYTIIPTESSSCVHEGWTHSVNSLLWKTGGEGGEKAVKQGQKQDIKTFKTLAFFGLQKLADSFTTLPGLEEEEYGLQVMIDTGPYTTVLFVVQFTNGKWAVPTEVLKVKLDYGAGIGWVIPGIRLIELNVEDSTGVHHFSTDNIDGYDSACFFGVQNEALKQSAAVVLKEYAVPEFQKSIGLKWGRLTFRAQDGCGTFNVLDGSLVDVSTLPPAFLNSLRAPEMSPVTSGPKISRISRKGNTTEITVSAEAGSKAYLEFAQSLSGTWNAVPAYPVLLSLQTGQSTFTHTTESPATFYRLRID
jgi:hypothetical protein